MAVLFWSCAAVGMGFLVHLAVWRVRPPRRQTRTLLLLFFGVSAVLLALLAAVPAPNAWMPWPSGPVQFAHIALFVVAFTLAYTITYSAIEVDSPSLIMTLAVAAAGEGGLPPEALMARLSDAVLINPRVADALRDGLLRQEGERLQLTVKGRRFVGLFLLFRAVLAQEREGEMVVLEWLMALAAVAGLAADVAVNVVAFRLVRKLGLLKSECLGFLAGAAVTAGLSWWSAIGQSLAGGETAALLAVNLALFAALGYGYFHFVNLGETARRVRILREVLDGGGAITREELLHRYNGAEIVRIRLGRLLGAGQIVLRDGRYRIGNRSVLRMARLMVFLKVLLLGKRSEFDR